MDVGWNGMETKLQYLEKIVSTLVIVTIVIVIVFIIVVSIIVIVIVVFVSCLLSRLGGLGLFCLVVSFAFRLSVILEFKVST